MSTTDDAESAWIEYRDDYARRSPWSHPRRQLRKREFIAGYLLAAGRVAYSLQRTMGRPATCQVYDRGRLVFSGRDFSADLVDFGRVRG